MELEQFSKLEIAVPSCGVTVERGEGFALDYHLSNAYEITEMGVKNGVFVFRCEHRYPAALVHWDWKANYLRLTIPAEARLEGARISNISGPVTVTGLNTAQLEAKTVSGKLELTGSSADLLQARTTSGALLLSGCAAGQLDCGTVSGSLTGEGICASEGVRCHSTSGAVRLSGELRGRIDCRTTSGSVRVSGDVRGNLELRSTSGSVDAELSGAIGEFSYSLHSVSGSRKVNGQNADSCVAKDAPNSVTAHTVSGSIRVNFAG